MLLCDPFSPGLFETSTINYVHVPQLFRMDVCMCTHLVLVVSYIHHFFISFIQCDIYIDIVFSRVTHGRNSSTRGPPLFLLWCIPSIIAARRSAALVHIYCCCTAVLLLYGGFFAYISCSRKSASISRLVYYTKVRKKSQVSDVGIRRTHDLHPV